MYLSVIIVLVLALTANARDCLKAAPVKNFDMKKYEGAWNIIAYLHSNQSEPDLFQGATCVNIIFKGNENYLETAAGLLRNGKPEERTGNFIPPNRNVAFFTNNFPYYPEFREHTFKIVCTDYDNYAVFYLSRQFEAGHCSEFAAIEARDRTKYSELLTNKDLRKCIQDEFQIPMEKFVKTENNNCPR